MQFVRWHSVVCTCHALFPFFHLFSPLPQHLYNYKMQMGFYVECFNYSTFAQWFPLLQFPKSILIQLTSNTRQRLAHGRILFFRRGAEFWVRSVHIQRTSGSKKGTARPTNTNPQSDTDQQPYHRGMLGSIKRGGEFQQHHLQCH